MSSHPSPIRLILPIRAIDVAVANVNISASPKVLERMLLKVNISELGDSEGTRRRIDAVRGLSVHARAKRCGNGFNKFEGTEWLMDGVKDVGRSYLGNRSLRAQTEVEGRDAPPYTHDEHFVSLHGEIPLMLEDARKTEQTSPIARRTLWKHDNRAVCSFPHLLQALVFLLVVGGLRRDPSGVGDHRPKRDDFETENLRARS